MHANNIRQTIAETLEDAEVDVSQARLEAFAATGKDIGIHELELDSLTRLDLLVALETEYDAVISPEQFSKFRGLIDLLDFVVNSLDKPSSETTNVALQVDSEEPFQTTTPPKIVLVFQRAFRFCRTVAQLNKLVRTLDSHCSPIDVKTLMSYQAKNALLPPNTPKKFHSALNKWLIQTEEWLSHAGKAQPEAFSATKLAPTIRYFVGPGQPQNKYLLIGFAGKGGRSMLVANTVLLQHLDASKCDVLVVGDPSKTGFRTAPPPFLGSTTNLINAIANLDILSKYKEIRLIGTSAGAYPALLCAHRLGATRTLSVGGRFPSERHLMKIIKMICLMWLNLRNRDCKEVILSYSIDKRRDRKFARFVSKLTNSNLVALKNQSGPTGHRVLKELLDHQQLSSFLEQFLLDDELELLNADHPVFTFGEQTK